MWPSVEDYIELGVISKTVVAVALCLLTARIIRHEIKVSAILGAVGSTT